MPSKVTKNDWPAGLWFRRHRAPFVSMCVSGDGASWERGRPARKAVAASWERGRPARSGPKARDRDPCGRKVRAPRDAWIPACAGMTKAAGRLCPGGTPRSQDTSPWAEHRHGSPNLHGPGLRCPKSPRLRRVAGGTPALPGGGPSSAGGTPASRRDAPFPGKARIPHVHYAPPSGSGFAGSGFGTHVRSI